MSLINFMCFSLVVFINNFVPPANLPFIKLPCHILCSFAVKIFILSILKEEENDEMKSFVTISLLSILYSAAGCGRRQKQRWPVSCVQDQPCQEQIPRFVFLCCSFSLLTDVDVFIISRSNGMSEFVAKEHLWISFCVRMCGVSVCYIYLLSHNVYVVMCESVQCLTYMCLCILFYVGMCT